MVGFSSGQPGLASSRLKPPVNSNCTLDHCDASGGSRPPHQERTCTGRISLYMIGLLESLDDDEDVALNSVGKVL